MPELQTEHLNRNRRFHIVIYLLQGPNICKICEYCVDSQNFCWLLKILLNVFTVHVILSSYKEIQKPLQIFNL